MQPDRSESVAVGRRTHRRAGHDLRRAPIPGSPNVCPVAPDASPGAFHPLRAPEVDERRPWRFGPGPIEEDDVGRGHVTVHDTGAVQRVERLGQVRQRTTDLGRAPRSSRRPVEHRRARQARRPAQGSSRRWPRPRPRRCRMAHHLLEVRLAAQRSAPSADGDAHVVGDLDHPGPTGAPSRQPGRRNRRTPSGPTGIRERLDPPERARRPRLESLGEAKRCTSAPFARCVVIAGACSVRARGRRYPLRHLRKPLQGPRSGIGQLGETGRRVRRCLLALPWAVPTGGCARSGRTARSPTTRSRPGRVVACSASRSPTAASSPRSCSSWSSTR